MIATNWFDRSWLKLSALALVLTGWTGYALAAPTTVPTSQPAKKVEAKKAEAPAETPIPVLTSPAMTSYKPSAAQVLTPPAKFTGEVQVAKTPPTIDFGIFPGQGKPANLWSNWGDSAFMNGNFYCTIGNHDAPHGVALVFKVDPNKKTMEKVVDYNQVAGLTDMTQYAPGKVHSPLMDGGDGWLYFFGYRGGGTKAEWGYVGDPLLRFNPSTGAAENLGPAIPDNSVACSQIHVASRMVYVLGNHGQTAKVQKDQFYAYNLDTRKLIFGGGPEPLMARAMMVAPDGRVYYSVAKPGTGRLADKTKKDDKGEPPVGVLAKYDPKTNEVTTTGIKVPGDGCVRVASRADAQGLIYGITKEGTVFAFDTKAETFKEMGPATFAGPGYTASVKLDPTERYLYYIPSAHGGSKEHGTAVFQLDVKTGQRKVLAFVHDFIAQQTNYNLGGTFGIALNQDASQLAICFNGRPIGGKNDDFGQCSVMIVHIPESERNAK